MRLIFSYQSGFKTSTLHDACDPAAVGSVTRYDSPLQYIAIDLYDTATDAHADAVKAVAAKMGLVFLERIEETRVKRIKLG